MDTLSLSIDLSSNCVPFISMMSVKLANKEDGSSFNESGIGHKGEIPRSELYLFHAMTTWNKLSRFKWSGYWGWWGFDSRIYTMHTPSDPTQRTPSHGRRWCPHRAAPSHPYGLCIVKIIVLPPAFARSSSTSMNEVEAYSTMSYSRYFERVGEDNVYDMKWSKTKALCFWFFQPCLVIY